MNLAALAKPVQGRIVKAPEKRGADARAHVPYSGNLKHYRQFRVGDHRLICRQVDETMVVLLVAHRSVAYGQISAKRLANRSQQS